jgi:nucleotide-binding universal stress UspA family protein
MTAHSPTGHVRAVQQADGAGRCAALSGMFSSALCAVETSATDRAARSHAALLAGSTGTVELVLTTELMRHGDRALRDRCEGHDLLALGAGRDAYTAVQHSPIPALIARWCPLGTDVTDAILVPVEDSPASGCAVELAGRLAAAHGGRVTILAAPPRDAALQRAIAASGRILLRATGQAPRVLGNPLSRDRTIPSAAAAINTSLVVLGAGSSDIERSTTARIVGLLGCSVLTVPAAPRIRTTRHEVARPTGTGRHPRRVHAEEAVR